MYSNSIEIIIIFITLAITLGSSAYIKIKYNATRKIKSKKGLTGGEVARKILDENGLTSVRVEEVTGELSDHYDPNSKVVRLSSDICNNTSIASIAVASHECGHAIQDKNGYLFLRLRSFIFPLVKFASTAGYWVILVSLIFQAMDLLLFGILLEVIILLFQIITLPVEFNASSRALKQIKKLDIVDKKELSEARGMLIAAALTYVAGVASAVLEIVRLLLIFRSEDR